MTLKEIVEDCLNLERRLSQRPSGSPATASEVAHLSSLVREALENIFRAAELFKGNGSNNR